MKLIELYIWSLIGIAFILILIIFKGIKSDIKWWVLAFVMSIILRKLIRSK